MAEIQKDKDPTEQIVTRELFIHLVSMFTTSALQGLGKIPNPMTGKPEVNLEGAQTMIAMLEMLEAKTDGNLDKEEAHLLKNAVSSLQMTFVEELEELKRQGVLGSNPLKTSLTETGEEFTPAATKQEAADKSKAIFTTAPDSKPQPETPKPVDDTRKKFTKKYE